ncbi:hypothetical protein DACRYDRAFT_89289 [Dacryopinax primogenitus]|uniref:Uncharacterized protein n=1 Tax=Dacryopinax primogenitus (strain DJM 731) TaxID=1858805 RepID=M5FYH6_DACPD|nr:uncharacterized protein DACRYDRAFT_89289 [Dacryopinax primogenitus]EJU01574.1 hypothetical protein DACRYDRAFT_89289 [Dacryopinax primogenitus]
MFGAVEANGDAENGRRGRSADRGIRDGREEEHTHEEDEEAQADRDVVERAHVKRHKNTIRGMSSCAVHP